MEIGLSLPDVTDMKLLVVDDSAMMRAVVKNTIVSFSPNKEGIEIVEASDGQQALDRLADGADLVLLDWQMPVIDGLSFVKTVRSSGNNVPIIMVTSVTDPDKVMEAGMAGVNAYIEKPVRGNVLWDKIAPFIQ